VLSPSQTDRLLSRRRSLRTLIDSVGGMDRIKWAGSISSCGGCGISRTPPQRGTAQRTVAAFQLRKAQYLALFPIRTCYIKMCSVSRGHALLAGQYMQAGTCSTGERQGIISETRDGRSREVAGEQERLT
jgi:hypothetical protein